MSTGGVSPIEDEFEPECGLHPLIWVDVGADASHQGGRRSDPRKLTRRFQGDGVKTMAQQWYYARGDQRTGPITSKQLKTLAASGGLRPTDLVWAEGMEQWKEARLVQGLFHPDEAGHRQGPPPLPTDLPGAPTIAAQGGPYGDARGKETGGTRSLRESLTAATLNAGEAIRQVGGNQTVQAALGFASDFKEGIAEDRSFAGLPASEWKRLALLVGAAGLATAIGFYRPAVGWLFLLGSIWVFRDARLRGNSAVKWSLATIPFGPTVLPFYLSSRHLREGEAREGGRAWNVLKLFALFWTVTIAMCAFIGIGGVSETAAQASSDAERAGVAIGATIGLGLLFVFWFFPFVGSLLLGLLLKKSSVVERGPTGGGGSTVHGIRKPFLIAGAVGFLVVMVAGGMRESGEAQAKKL